MKADDRHKTQDLRLKTQDPRLKTEDSRLKRQVYSILRLASCVLCLMSFILLLPASSSFAQTRQEEDRQPVAEPYHESALRRFEIIFTISLPFTALHSYLVVRGVEGIRQRKIAPELKRSDWNTIGGLTILFSGFVAFWDWLHVRDEDISEKMPGPRDKTVPYSGYSMLDTRYSMPASSIQHPASNIQYPAIIFLSARF
jgi:hypothetical protein